MLSVHRLKILNRRFGMLFTTTGLKVVLFGIITIMFIWMLVQVFQTREAQFEIIILDKNENVKLAEESGGWTWSVTGFEYFQNLNESPLHKTNIVKSGPYNGLWIFRKNQNTINQIKLTDFQYKTPLKVMLGLRYYISGSGRIEITFRDALYGNTETFALLQDEEEDTVAQGFCSKIITPGFDRLIDMIEIRAYTVNPTSMVVIDKVIVTVADGDSSRNLIYSLIPNQWCEVRDPSTKTNHSNRVPVKKLSGSQESKPKKKKKLKSLSGRNRKRSEN